MLGLVLLTFIFMLTLKEQLRRTTVETIFMNLHFTRSTLQVQKTCQQGSLKEIESTKFNGYLLPEKKYRKLKSCIYVLSAKPSLTKCCTFDDADL